MTTAVDVTDIIAGSVFDEIGDDEHIETARQDRNAIRVQWTDGTVTLTTTEVLRPAWQHTDTDTWESETCHGTVTADPITGWEWLVMVATDIITGPYPGTPDWIERVIGEGCAPSLPEAMWQCERAWARAEIIEEVAVIEENAMLDAMEREEAER